MEGNQNSGSVTGNRLPVKTHGEYLLRVYFRVSENLKRLNFTNTFANQHE